jgi:FtsP/CotA-like multicopper oxidase with cupredoxin domain
MSWRDLERVTVTTETPIRGFVLGQKDPPGGARLFTINDEAWPDNAPVEVKLGDIEIWEIRNATATDHPVHLHGMFFEVLADVSGQRPRPDGLKDTVNVRRGSTVRFAVRFDVPGIWMLHCHILEHADAGMLVNVIVRE